MMSRRFLTVSVALLCALAPAMAQGGKWISRGPYGGGLYGLVVNPVNPAVAFAEGPGGVLRSNNFGKTWRRPFTLYYAKARIFARDPRRVVVAGSTIYRSSNGGQSWSAPGYFYPMWNAGLDDIQFHSRNPDVLYALACCGQGFGRSTDGGRTWRLAARPSASGYFGHMAVDPQIGEIVYLVLSGRLYKTTNGGDSWRNITGSLRLRPDNVLLTHPTDSRILFAADANGIRKSTDAGASWTVIKTGFFTESMAINPGNPQEVYASGRGLIHSTDGGKTWTSISTPDDTISWSAVGILPGTILINSPQTGILRRNPDLTWQDSSAGLNLQSIHELELNSSRPAEILASASMSLPFRTTDGGVRWNRLQAGHYFGRFHPANADLLASAGSFQDPATSARRSIVVSKDGGQSWVYKGPGGGAASLTWDPDNQNSFYFALYRNSKWDFAQTLDQGTTWKVLRPGLSYPPLVHLGRNPAAIYLKVSKHFYRSTDQGSTWKDLTTALPSGWIGDVAMDPQNGNTLYLVQSQGQPIFSTVFKSMDGGEQWYPMNEGIPHFSLALNCLAIDPTDPQTVYTAGVSAAFVTKDGGIHWDQIPNFGLIPYEQIYDIAISPADPKRIYIATSTGVYRWQPDNAD